MVKGFKVALSAGGSHFMWQCPGLLGRLHVANARLGVINRACALEAGGGGRQEAAGGGGIPQDREKADLRLRDGSILKYETRRAPFRPG